MDGTSDENVTEGESSNKLECAVCLQQCIQPVQLPCRHIFCYLCVKGVTQQSKRCAMCRQEIPLNYLDNPQLIFAPQASVAFEGEYQWFYEGRNGWWQYDDRTSTEIEAAYKKGEAQCEVLIAGFLYIIDFEKNLQVRRCDPHRRRHIKRDLVTIAKKGVAGIRLDSSDNEIFNSIAQGLKSHGYTSITGQMCHEKSQSLKVSYVKVKDGQSKIGSAQITFEHSDEIDEITGKKPNVPDPIMHKNSDAGSSFQDQSSCSSQDEDIDEATPVDHACPTEKAKRKAPSNWFTVCEEIRKKRHEEKMAQMMKIHQDNFKIQNKLLNILEGFKK